MTSNTSIKANTSKDSEDVIENMLIASEDNEDALIEFRKAMATDKNEKRNRKYKKKQVNITMEDISSNEKMQEIARQIIAESKQDKPTSNERICIEVFKMETTTLFTAKHFSDKLNISFTAVYNLMDKLKKDGKIRILVMPNRRKYYTSIENKMESIEV